MCHEDLGRGAKIADASGNKNGFGFARGTVVFMGVPHSGSLPIQLDTRDAPDADAACAGREGRDSAPLGLRRWRIRWNLSNVADGRLGEASLPKMGLGIAKSTNGFASCGVPFDRNSRSTIVSSGLVARKSLTVTIQLGRMCLLDLFAQSVVVRRLQIYCIYARASLLALCKNLLRNHILPN
jgi:hypothetical protein